MVHFLSKALFAIVFATAPLGSCGENQSKGEPNSPSQMEADAKKVIFDPKSSRAAIAEGVFLLFCAKSKCRERSDYDVNIPDVKVRTILEFKNKNGIDMKQDKFDYFSCSVTPSAVHCDGFEQPILLRENP